jgi:glycosyltransferase involved in cell wall biosynthesis
MYKMGAVILILPFYFRFWRSYVQRIYRNWKFEALHIHDLPLARLGVEYKRKYGIRFVADQHELYSSWIVKTSHYNTLIGKVVQALSHWEKYERTCLREADLVCTVEEPLKSIYIQKHKIAREKLIVIPNTPLKSIYTVTPHQQSSDHFSLLYCGGMDVLRGLGLAIRAIPFLKDKIPQIKVILIGKMNKHFDPREFASSLGVEDHLELREWVDYRDLPHEIDRADICFFTPPADREEIHNTIATKIYQYMARGKPVVVGSARYMKWFVEEHEIGIAVDETKPEAFAEAVLKLYRDRILYKKYSTNALNTIGHYYWEVTIRKLIEFYAAAGS